MFRTTAKPRVLVLDGVEHACSFARSIRSDAALVARMNWYRGWLLLATLPSAVLLFTPATWPRWMYMWMLAFAIFAGCKWLTWRRTPMPHASLARHLGYLFAWPGLDAAAFLDPHPAPPIRAPKPIEWLFAASKLSLGLLLLFVVARQLPADDPYLVGWVGM